ncbi:MAG: hypothetical protein HKN21_04810 [Candidatus Eisenbacteria bacterium]|uniref:Flagellar FliJ protein n=1 Tax=Eiseniibacteriota bacterium TaxID=2212470 RepID=A0A7Y2E6D2_UNCEI|nr:hypothetical protein [Candidatus Eisenbacteria bacterium]
MKPFAFRLERLLKLRRQQVRERRRELGVVLSEERQFEEKCRVALEHLRRCQNQSSDGGEATIGAMRNRMLTTEAAEAVLNEARNKLSRVQERVLVCREAYQVAFRDAEVLEKLYRKNRESWKVELTREEQKELDRISQQIRSQRGDR